MAVKISTADARKNLADIVNRVAYGKEPIILTRRGQDVAALISIEELELLQLLEDHIDIEDAKQALTESSDNIPADVVWKELGL
jgi:antitoxin Phd